MAKEIEGVYLEQCKCAVIRMEYNWNTSESNHLTGGVGRLFLAKGSVSDLAGAVKIFTDLPMAEPHTIQVFEEPGNLLNVYERCIDRSDKWKCTYSVKY